MQIYMVGGAVRDELLGLPVTDRDYVVVGGTPEEMVRMGFRPVGKDFPVFLHPETSEEYALARTERKTARGYKGFQVYAAPEVTLEQDLARRDFTINAIARDERGNLIDPFHGAEDLKAGILRHVSPAFAEDPVRILRAGRFAARYRNFTIAAETFVLMRQMVQSGEADALVPERVWQELARGLMERKPSRMFEVLRECGALEKILPEVNTLFGVPQPLEHHPEIDSGVHTMLVLDYAAEKNYSLPVRFAALTHDLGKGLTPGVEWPHHFEHEARGAELVKNICRRLRAPNDCCELARLAASHHGDVHHALELRPSTILKLLLSADALRKPARFAELLQVCESDHCGRPGFADYSYPQAELLRAALLAANSVDAGSIAQHYSDPITIKERIYEARLDAIKIRLGADTAKASQ